MNDEDWYVVLFAEMWWVDILVFLAAVWGIRVYVCMIDLFDICFVLMILDTCEI